VNGASSHRHVETGTASLGQMLGRVTMTVTRRSSRRLVLLGAIPLVSAGLLSSALPAQASSRAAVAGGTGAWIAKAHNLGRPSAAHQVAVQVYLAPRGGQAALDAAVAAVSTPGSSSYHHFLSVSGYLAKFEAPDSEVASVSDWLRSNGLRITGVESAHRYVSASGSVSAVEQAFNTTLGTFRHSGQVVTAPTIPATIPSSLAGQVLAVGGVDSTVAYVKPDARTGPPPAFENARPCSVYYGQIEARFQADGVTPLPNFHGSSHDYAVCGYAPDQFRAAYEGGTSLTGAGVTVAITDAYGAATILKDANQYSSINGEPTFAPGQFTQSVPGTFTNQAICGSWQGEETLDVEAVHGMAPNANVHYYGGKSCLDSDLRNAIGRVLTDNSASIITNSWGNLGEEVPGNEVIAYGQLFNQAAMQGISVMFSSGDSGDEVATTGLRQADFPATSPLVTAVGGVSTKIGPSGALIGQTGWGTDKYSLSADGTSWVPIAPDPFLYGSGGGYSAIYNRPSYQNGVVPVGQSGRAVPDVALDGDPTTGMLVGETQLFPDGSVHFSEYRIGGTSVASPLFAGMTALASEHAGQRLGLLNPAIYHQALTHAGTFTDVLPVSGANVRPDYRNGVDPTAGIAYSVRTFDNDSSLMTTAGWDDVTGVGTPNGNYLTAF
jgi:subtilase family serine protease